MIGDLLEGRGNHYVTRKESATSTLRKCYAGEVSYGKISYTSFSISGGKKAELKRTRRDKHSGKGKRDEVDFPTSTNANKHALLALGSACTVPK